MVKTLTNVIHSLLIGSLNFSMPISFLNIKMNACYKMGPFKVTPLLHCFILSPTIAIIIPGSKVHFFQYLSNYT